MPSLLRALRVGEKAAHLGLDWRDAQGPRAKVDEELGELDEAIAQGSRDAIEAELGDVLFSLVSVARKQNIDPDAALRRTIEGFSARVRFVESAGRERGLDPKALPDAVLDALWNEAKEATRA
jgi:uncharacterized protein YabN with tetrapyrrole methylase and pyrophosphatase domain